MAWGFRGERNKVIIIRRHRSITSIEKNCIFYTLFRNGNRYILNGGNSPYNNTYRHKEKKTGFHAAGIRVFTENLCLSILGWDWVD